MTSKQDDVGLPMANFDDKEQEARGGPPKRQVTKKGGLVTLSSITDGTKNILNKVASLNPVQLFEKEQRKPVEINLISFPTEVQHIFKEFDNDGDGILDANELGDAARAYQSSKNLIKRLFRFLIMGAFMLTMICAALAGVVYAVVVLTRQTDLATDGIMKVKGTQEVVKLSAKAELTTSSLNSDLMPASTFRDLRYLQLFTDNGSELNIQVHATAMIPRDPTNLDSGNYVIIVSSVGSIYLDGEDILFTDETATLFSDAGLQTMETAGGRRKLLGSGNSLGAFNTLNVPATNVLQKLAEVYINLPNAAKSVSQQIRDQISLSFTADDAAECTLLQSLNIKRKSRNGRQAVYNLPPGVDADTFLAELKADPNCNFAGGYVDAQAGLSRGAPRRELLQTVYWTTATLSDTEYKSFRAGDLTKAQNVRMIKADTVWNAWPDIQNTTVYKTANYLKVCIVDTGVDFTHSELSGASRYLNAADLINTPSVDNDANGLKDDFYGARYVGAANDGTVMDDNGHGTGVTGVIAAAANNAAGITGVFPWVKTPNCKAMDLNGAGTLSDIEKCINWCSTTAHAVKVIQMSLNSNTTNQATIDYWSNNVFGRTTAPTTSIAPGTTADKLFVISAGNQGLNLDTDPWGYGFPATIRRDNVISVGSYTYGGARSTFSNYSPIKIDVGAPGDGIPTTLTTDRYQTAYGTSFAAPHVSAVAMMMFTKNTALTAQQVKRALKASCVRTAGSTEAQWNACNGYIQMDLAYNMAVNPALIPSS